jgi:hypothetical protein
VDSSVSEAIVPTDSPRFVLAFVVSLPGVVLAAWTMSLFIRFGDGTAVELLFDSASSAGIGTVVSCSGPNDPKKSD